ncbi:SLIDE domain-containing protein, partial [Helicosporidium sp. ATCC 50920]
GAGFSAWSRRDYLAFVRACERHGREALPEIARELESKSLPEVREYAAVFWARVQELGDAERILKNVERGEARLRRQRDIMAALAAKLERYANPWQDLRIAYGPAKGKAYTEEEDRFLLCMTHQLGYGAWDELKAEIRDNVWFRFDWFLKSRQAQELARRCDTLIRLIEKENEEEDERDQALRKKGAKGRRLDDADGTPGPEGPPKKRRASPAVGEDGGRREAEPSKGRAASRDL